MSSAGFPVFPDVFRAFAVPLLACLALLPVPSAGSAEPRELVFLNWADYLDPELARAFANFLNEPGNAAQLAQFVYFATPNQAAEKLLPDGYEDVRSTLEDLPNVTEEEGGSPWFQAMARAAPDVTTQVVRSEDTGRLSMLVAKPVLLNDPAVDPALARPRLRGYMVLSVSLDVLNRLARERGIGSAGHLFVVDDTGRVRFPRHPGSVARDLPGQLFQTLRTGNGVPVAGEGPEGPGLYELRSLHPGLFLVGDVPFQDLQAAGRRLTLQVAAVLGLATLITLVLVLWALRWLLVKPVGQLHAAATRIGRGELEATVPVAARDEIGELGQAVLEPFFTAKDAIRGAR